MTFELSESPRPEYFSGIAKFEVKPTIDDCLGNRFTSYDSAQIVKPEKYSSFLQDLGLVTPKVEIRSVNSRENPVRSYIAIKSQFAKGVDVVQLVDADTSQRPNQNDPYELEDIVFVANDSGKAFGLKSILEEKKIIIDPKLQKGFGGENDVRFLPIGVTEAPKNPIWKLIRHYYKSIEGVIMLHEVAHTEQRLQEIIEKGGIKKMGSLWIEKYQGLAFAERDAWRFALQGIRQLRQQGINLIPDLTNQQIIDHIELALMGYDRGYPYPMYRRYSRKVGQPREKLPPTAASLVSPVYYTAKSWVETAKIIAKNPTIVTQGLKSEID